jgi:hypothetical protein
MYDDILNKFCQSCLGISVNGQHTVKDIVLAALKAGESNDIRGVIGGCMALKGALAVLEEKDGCNSCINGLQRTITALQSL